MSEAVLAQLYAIKAQVDAAILVALNSQPQAPPLDPAETCPKCGASGETQLDTSTLDGTQRRKCTVCGEGRTL